MAGVREKSLITTKWMEPHGKAPPRFALTPRPAMPHGSADLHLCPNSFLRHPWAVTPATTPHAAVSLRLTMPSRHR